MTTKAAIINYLNTHPNDILSWAALVDVLEAEGAPSFVIQVARQCGLWRGTRTEWENQGPCLLDVVPVFHIWIVNMGVAKINACGSAFGFYVRPVTQTCWDADDIPSYWCLLPPDEWVRFPSVEQAQRWLTEVSLEYARRLRDGEDEVSCP